MIIGFDKGATATKIVGMRGRELLFKSSFSGDDAPAGELILRVISENGCLADEVELIAATGVGAEDCDFSTIAASVKPVPEIEATGEGGMFLAGLSEGVVVSIGTGTSLALAKGGKYSHIGGSGVGSGTLRGLCKYMFGKEDLKALFGIAEEGNRLLVDLTIADLFSGTDTLPPDLTASNLAKASDGATAADWAQAVINMVLEVAGSHAALACGGYGVKNVVITGGVAVTPIAKRVYDGFTRLYGLNYIIPQNADCATAIGAARRAENGI